jgi:hypothetical protein
MKLVMRPQRYVILAVLSLIYLVKGYSNNPYFPFFTAEKQEEPKTRLDSMVQESWNQETNRILPSGKKVFTYTTHKKATQLVHSQYNAEQAAWIPYVREQYDFDSNAYPILFLQYAWDLENNKWNIQKREESKYDTSGNKIVSIDYRLLDPNNPQESNKYLISANDNKEVSLSFTLDGLSNSSVLTEGEVITRDSDGNIIEHHTYDRDNPNADQIAQELVPDSKEEYVYSASGSMISSKNFFWDSDSNKWVLEQWIKNEFDTNDNEILSDMHRFNKSINVWEHSLRSESVYDTTGKPILLVSYGYNAIKKDIVYSSKHVSKRDKYTYENEYYSWNDREEKWEERQRTEIFSDSLELKHTTNDYKWDNYYKQWILNRRVESEYDTTTKQSVRLQYKTNSYTNELFAYEMDVQDYSKGDLGESYTNYYRDAEGLAWILAEKRIVVYDTNRRLIEETNEVWRDSFFAGEQRHQKENYTYNDKGEKTCFIASNFDNLSLKWIEVMMEKYHYNEYGDMIKKLVYQKSPLTNEWVLVAQSDFYFSAL